MPPGPIELPASSDIEAWLVEKSQGTALLDGFQSVAADLSEAEAALCEAYQAGLLGRDARLRREGQTAVSEMYRDFAALVGRSSVGYPLVCYRALSFVDIPTGADELIVERALSSWSLYPSVALRTGLVTGAASPVALIACRLLPNEPSLYLDEFEHEVVRTEQLRMRELDSVTGQVYFMGEHIDIVLLSAEIAP